jgi:PAS domain S-box-containing protein
LSAKNDPLQNSLSDQGYWEIAEHAMDGFYRVDVQGNLLAVSPKAVKTLGYERPDELVGKVSMAEMWANPSERDILLDELREHGEVRSFETTLKRKDGGLIRVELSVVRFLNDAGEMIGTDGVVREVTDRSRSEQQFRSLIRNSPGALFRYEAGDNPRYTFMSDTIEAITGYPGEYFTSQRQPLTPLIHPDEPAGTEALDALVIQAGEQYSLEVKIRRADGEARWIQLQGSASRDPISGIELVDGVIVDITDTHTLAEELAERERQVQSLIRNVPGAIYRFAEQADGVWRFDYMSPAIEALTGYSPEFFVHEADPFERILHPLDRDMVGEAITEAVASNNGFNFEHRILHKDGSVRWIRVQGSMAWDDKTGLRSVDGVQLDVSDLYAAREAVEESEATFRHLFDSMAEGYWVSDLQGIVEMSNPAAGHILGYPESESVIGLNSLNMMLDVEKRDDFIAELIEHGHVENYEIEVKGYADKVICLNFSTRLTGEGEQLKSESTFRDVTEQKRQEQEIREARHAAEQANRAKSTFLANMSHELRTPLNAIIGYSEMMQEEAEELEEDVFSEDLSKVHSAGTHLLSLINDVLDLSKIEAGRTELFLEDFSLQELVNSVTATVEPLISANSNRLQLEVADGEVELHQDLTKLRQSLLNLLSNAAKFTDQGEVTLIASQYSVDGRDWLKLSVRDTGIGIAADKHEQLFDEFSQADASTTRQYGGTGLGLAISRRFCQMMGGDIDLESSPGHGSTFTISIPLELDDAVSDATDTQTPQATPTLPKYPARTVLIIDDDPEACEIISRHLTRSGYEAVAATSGQQGLKLAREIQPCAITLDVMMPEMDGWSVLAELKADEALNDIPVVRAGRVEGGRSAE